MNELHHSSFLGFLLFLQDFILISTLRIYNSTLSLHVKTSSIYLQSGTIFLPPVIPRIIYWVVSLGPIPSFCPYSYIFPSLIIFGAGLVQVLALYLGFFLIFGRLGAKTHTNQRQDSEYFKNRLVQHCTVPLEKSWDKVAWQASSKRL